MPASLDKCVRHLLADPNFKPKQQGQTKEAAAWAACQATLNKAIEDIQEAAIILKHFEEEPVQKDDLEVSNDSLTSSGDPLPDELRHAADPFQEVRLNAIGAEPANVLGDNNPGTDSSEDVTNVKGNPLINVG